MRKVIKVSLIVLLTLVGLFITTVSFALWFVFTPDRISPVINTQARKMVDSEVHVEVGRVELTFFSTFPRLGLKVDRVMLVNPMGNAPSDTLLAVETMKGVIDTWAFWRRNQLILSGVTMINGSINIFTDSLGRTNYDIFPPDTIAEPETETEFTLSFIDLGQVEFSNVNLTYVDEPMKFNTGFRNLNAMISGKMLEDTLNLDLKFEVASLSISFEGEQYLDNVSLKGTLPATVFSSELKVDLQRAQAIINGMPLLLSGLFRYDDSNGDFHTDMQYSFSRLPVKNLLALVPPSFQSYFKGMDMDGILSSEGKITGIYNDSLMPLMDMKFQMVEGKFSYTEIPLPLHDMKGDVHIFTDLEDDEKSFVRIHQFSARTPNSSFETEGVVTRLFSDMHCELTSRANILLSELAPLVPDTIPLKMSGRIIGEMVSRFTLTDLEEMNLEKINISGELRGQNLDILYDSIWMKTNRAQLAFAMPNHRATTPQTRFTFADITTGIFQTGKIDNYEAYFTNAVISLEMSDPSDTTRIPSLITTFAMDTLYATMDTITVAASRPDGKAWVSPVEGRPEEPHIRFVYNSGGLHASMGTDKFIMDRISLDATVENDAKQTDIFLQWLARGFLDMENGYISSAILTQPLLIPAIRMNFEPEHFQVKESRLIIDKSDFELSGRLDNVLSYFRGDSILKGRFSFISENTDLLQMMTLTDGVGHDDDDKQEIKQESTTEKAETEASTAEHTGPYMVPKGMDLVLNTNVKKATFGDDTIRNITGDVRIADGILVIDDVKFVTSAARMQLTAMYRTPRKNHLYLGMNFHMFDIEIEQLLEMIPDIDTLMPMLRSFRGKGEFSMSIETYLDSLYNIKKSTLRGASSIRGQNLVLMDGETFSEIARNLRFSRRAENIVDTLSAEFTIFREEIDIYPFLMVMDRYRAVISGKHNLDMSFNYHISVVDSPVPIQFGLDVSGDLDNLKYKLVSARYANLYRPARRGAVESRQLELRRLINETITERLSRQE